MKIKHLVLLALLPLACGGPPPPDVGSTSSALIMAGPATAAHVQPWTGSFTTLDEEVVVWPTGHQELSQYDFAAPKVVTITPLPPNPATGYYDRFAYNRANLTGNVMGGCTLYLAPNRLGIADDIYGGNDSTPLAALQVTATYYANGCSGGHCTPGSAQPPCSVWYQPGGSETISNRQTAYGDGHTDFEESWWLYPLDQVACTHAGLHTVDCGFGEYGSGFYTAADGTPMEWEVWGELLR